MSIHDQYWARILPQDPAEPMLSRVISLGRTVNTNLSPMSLIELLHDIGWNLTEVTDRESVQMTNGSEYITVQKILDTSGQMELFGGGE